MTRLPVPRLILWLSWAALIWERVWPEIWLVPTLFGGYCAAALLGLLPFGPAWLQLLVWITGALVLVAVGLKAAAAIRWPDTKTLLRRIETASGLPHRPLSQPLDLDPEILKDPVRAALWQIHRQRIAASISRLRISWPDAALAARDPMALRAAATLLLLAGFVVAGDDASNRLMRGLLPAFGASGSAATATAELWITPPDYTGLPPVYLSTPNSDGDPIPVPAGSHLLVEVHNARTAPALRLDEIEQPLKHRDAGEYALSVTMAPTKTLRLRLGGTSLFSRSVRWIPDQPPAVAWTHRALQTAHGTLDLRFKATDDYGVTGLSLIVTPVQPGNAAASQTLPIAVPIPASRNVSNEAFEDLTASPWAGLPAHLELVARDALGQEGKSPAVTVILPERIFHNPVAQAIIAQRKILVRSPDRALDVADAISALSLQPSSYGNDPRAFLAMRVAAWQLAGDQSEAARDQAATLLWRIAVRIEDGAGGQAEANLRDAENTLRDALRRHAPPEEIHRLMQAVQRAIMEYLQAKMQHSASQPQQAQGSGTIRTITPDQIAAMLARAEALARAGDSAGADAMMAQLQQLMESLQFGNSQRGSGAGGLDRLAGLARQQQQLLDQSFQRENGVAGAPDQTASQQGQAALKRQLNALMKQMQGAGLPASPDLERAGKAMGDAVRALGERQDESASQAQAQALAAIRAGAQALEKILQGQAGGQDADGVQQDPFGRSEDQGRSAGDNELALPADPALSRSRAILDELRRRQGDLDRPQLERDYIDRLLQNF